MQDKPFDAVRFMRQVRDELSKKYLSNPQAQEKDLKRVRDKYNFILRKRMNANDRLRRQAVRRIP
jgi:hypothetical protein